MAATEERPTKNLRPAPSAAENRIPGSQEFHVRDEGEILRGHAVEETVPEDAGAVNDAVDTAIAAGPSARATRTASGSVTSQVRYMASIPAACKSAKVRAISQARGWSGADAEDEGSRCGARGWADGSSRVLPKYQARREGRQSAGQVGADPRGASRHDNDVLRGPISGLADRRRPRGPGIPAR